jgi:hypothetical protein
MAVTPLSEVARELEEAGPAAHGDPLGTPAANEKVLWKGRPNLSVLARTAFHTRSVGLYVAALSAISLALGNVDTAIICAVLAIVAVAILYGIAWLSARTTLYILTDTRLIMRIGMALEARINVPLKHVNAADLRMRGKDHGDIALKLGGERLLGYALLWPHARPWRYARPEPMLRAIPEAAKVAEMLAAACAAHAPIDQNLTEINDAASQPATAKPIPAATGRRKAETVFSDSDMKGAPA